MHKRPASITVIGWVFIATGGVGLAYHLAEIDVRHPFGHGLIWVCFVRILAVLGGVCLLLGFNWARWLLVLWLAFHVVVSAFQSVVELAVHGLLSVVIGYVLFRQQAGAYFRRRDGGTATGSKGA